MKTINFLLVTLVTLFGNFTFGQNGVTAYPITINPNSGKYAIKIDALGNKWICQDRYGILKFDGTNFTRYDTINSGIASTRTYDVDFDASNNLWIATNKGISKFDGTNWTTYNTSNSPLPTNFINKIKINGSTIWIGTQNGLVQFDGTNWTIYNTANSSLMNNQVTAINIDNNGDVWIGTSKGLCIKSGNNWTIYNDSNSNFVEEKITCILLQNNLKWFTTPSRIYEFKNNTLYSMNSRFMLNFYDLGANQNSLTMGPQGGIFNYNLKEIVDKQILDYNIGIVNPQTHNYEVSTNHYWFATNNTLYSFNPSNFSGPTLLEAPKGLNTLDINNVNAALRNRGTMHWAGTLMGYEVPKNSQRNSTFMTSLWIGGIDNTGQLHQAAMNYIWNGYDYWPGPLDTINATIDSVTSNFYDKIWKVERLQIEEFQTMFANGSVQNGNYTVPSDIITWPAHGTGNYSRNLAPFVDVNNDGLYNPLSDGDYPLIKGDQMCFWIFNDNMPHTSSGGLPLKVEIHASAYAYVCPDYIITDSNNVINYTTFYNYKIFNRSHIDYQNTRVGVFQDVELGATFDDYIGCSAEHNYGFVYNGNNVDAIGAAGFNINYGSNPPMQSTVILDGPIAIANDAIDNNNNGIIDELGEKNLMTNFHYYQNVNSVMGNPTNPMDFYNYLQSKWKDSTPVTYGGNGYGGNTPHHFMFDGTPAVFGWDEISASNPPGDRRFVIGCGPFDLNAGENINLDYAIVYTRDTTSAQTYTIQNLFQKNKQDVLRVKHWFDTNNFPSCLDLTNEQTEINEPISNSFLIYPNPAKSEISIAYKPKNKNTSIEIYNSIGQLIKSINNITENQQLSISELNNGMYILKLNDGINIATERFIKQ